MEILATALGPNSSLQVLKNLEATGPGLGSIAEGSEPPHRWLGVLVPVVPIRLTLGVWVCSS